MPLVAEPHGGAFEEAPPLDEHVIRAVHQDIADRRIGQQRLERAEAQNLVEQVLDQKLKYRGGHDPSAILKIAGGECGDLAAQVRAAHLVDDGEVQLLEQQVVQRALERGLSLGHRRGSGGRRRGD